MKNDKTTTVLYYFVTSVTHSQLKVINYVIISMPHYRLISCGIPATALILRSLLPMVSTVVHTDGAMGVFNLSNQPANFYKI